MVTVVVKDFVVVAVDYLDSRFLVLTNAINHFCCLTHSNTAFDYKATF